jgi:4-hydroxy-tetrahydrodipicolinate synthase
LNDVFRGTITALATPFSRGEPDLASLEKLVEWQIEQGVDGLLACGCTGEAAVLSHDEVIDVIETVQSVAADRVPVIAGTGKNDTSSTLDLSLEVSDMGVSALLLITPYYNKPTPAGQVAHYAKVADSVACPVILYNVPGRTGTCMEPATIAELSRHPRIVAIKDAAGDAERVSAIRQLCDITILSGDDPLTLAMIALGAEGVVSVVSNVAPAETGAMVRHALDGSFDSARELQDRLYPVMKAMFLETNPAPVKKALELMGIFTSADPRLPLVPLSDNLTERLRNVLQEAGLLK